MGARYAKAALEAARRAKLGHAAARLLVAMALTVRDRPSDDGEPEGLYFGGRIALAMDLGYGADDPDEAGSTRAYKAVDYAIASCVRAGLIRRAKVARAGARSEYDLTPLLHRARGQPVDKSKSAPQPVGS